MVGWRFNIWKTKHFSHLYLKLTLDGLLIGVMLFTSESREIKCVCEREWTYWFVSRKNPNTKSICLQDQLDGSRQILETITQDITASSTREIQAKDLLEFIREWDYAHQGISGYSLFVTFLQIFLEIGKRLININKRVSLLDSIWINSNSFKIMVIKNKV